MNKPLHNNIFLALLFFVLAFSSCGKKDSDDATPNAEEATCRLTQVSYDGDDDDISQIEYNSKGYVSKISSSGNDYVLFQYDNNNRLVKMEEFERGSLDYYSLYTYTGNNLTKVNWHDADGTLDETETLKYDSQNRIIEIIGEYDGEEYKRVFTYNSQGNVEKRESFDNGVLYSRVVYASYDDKKRFWSALKGYPYYYEGSSKNNMGRETYTSFHDGQQIGEHVSTYTYTYNDKGFPTKVVETYDGRTYTSNFTYQCN